MPLVARPGRPLPVGDLAEARGADHPVGPVRAAALLDRGEGDVGARRHLGQGVAHVVGHLLRPVGRVGPLVVAAVLAPPPRPGRGCAPRSAAPAGRIVPSSVNGSSMARRGRRRPRARLALASLGGGPVGAPVGTTKSRWRTSANPHTAPTRATTAPITIRWFSVAEKPDVVGLQQRVAGRRRSGWRAAAWRTSPAGHGAAGAAHRRGAAPRARPASCAARRWCGHDLALEHRAEHGDAGGDADLAEGVVGARGHAAALGLHDRDGARGQDRVDDPDAEARPR